MFVVAHPITFKLSMCLFIKRPMNSSGRKLHLIIDSIQRLQNLLGSSKDHC